MSQAPRTQTTSAPTGAKPSPALPRVLTLAVLVVLLLFVASEGSTLFREWLQLRGELSGVRTSTVVGYPGITPQYSYARMPPDWFHDEGETTLLWGGWRNGTGHLWFRVARGEVDRARISSPMGRDVIRAIDHPVVEQSGGRLWSKIPDEAPVVGFRIAGVDTAYPLLVLNKVLVVNDVVGEHPSLVLNSPRGMSLAQGTSVYDPVVDGRRLTMGLSGYFQQGKPLLYDRGTESLWVDDDDALLAIAGRHKGRRLPSVARAAPVSWNVWRSQHPGSRLVVGADRSRQPPES